ncbi:ABC-type nitrate/sulfonate/bicarbonate transport system permease component [Bacillus pakistanensis]|uniref:ABC-type nitrate/sulfonate/bicarbonate transport system permease component n=1 Tax=Rossellomorea pakistanensis TaxID=992288 RepID=A0ABS2NEY2_9BACI|nr:ABC transporter permease [Bacillus pakistanensis]MBM7586375.1 ABC-type nitrate/sulfonate/bicarbonate transport system permease component [Bacillus pakistanensis]
MNKTLSLKGWRPLVVIILLFIIWECSTRFGRIPAWLLPAPSEIVAEAIDVWPNFQIHLLSTIKLTLIGFVIGCSFGLIIAISLHMIPIVRESIYPLIILSQNIPIIVLAPLLVVWFGFGLMPKIIVITLVCFFPIAVATMDGFRQTGQELKHYMQMAGASKWQIFTKLEWPHALPSIFSGLKISATYSVMGAVISEWLGAKSGVGVFMTLASSSFRTDRVFVAIFAIMVLSLSFFAFIIALEKWMIKWRPQGEK